MQKILKEELSSYLSDKKIIDSLFYSFGFDPKFFENYVMLTMVDEVQNKFTNKPAVNNYIWRRLYTEEVVPPISVYFDNGVKNSDNGPLLGYDVVPVFYKYKEERGCFHPKLSFFLVEKKDKTLELLVVNGSNNLTASGWCINIEAFQFIKIQEGSSKALVEELKNFIEEIKKITYNPNSNLKNSEAEQIILKYLKGIKPEENTTETPYFYH